MVNPFSVAVTSARFLTLALVHTERVLVVIAQLRRALARVAVHDEARLAQARETYSAIRQTQKHLQPAATSDAATTVLPHEELHE